MQDFNQHQDEQQLIQDLKTVPCHIAIADPPRYEHARAKQNGDGHGGQQNSDGDIERGLQQMEELGGADAQLILGL